MEQMGWIQLHRKFIDWEWYDDINTKVLFIHCLLKANHVDKKWRGVDINRGEFLTSYSNLSIETGLSVQKVRTSISNLESTGEVTRQSTSKLTKLTICKYDTYNNLKSSANKQGNTQITNEQQTNNKPITTTKNDNNKKNIKNEKNKESKEDLETFDYFRRGYNNLGGSVRGNETEFANFKKKHKDWKEVLPDLDQLLLCISNQRIAMSQAGQFVPPWKNLGTWINGRFWEEETAKVVKPVFDPKTFTGH